VGGKGDSTKVAITYGNFGAVTTSPGREFIFEPAKSDNWRVFASEMLQLH
jgi:hypothetical protein